MLKFRSAVWANLAFLTPSRPEQMTSASRYLFFPEQRRGSTGSITEMLRPNTLQGDANVAKEWSPVKVYAKKKVVERSICDIILVERQTVCHEGSLKRGTAGSAGFDVYASFEHCKDASEDTIRSCVSSDLGDGDTTAIIRPGARTKVPLGFSMRFPDNVVALLKCRSSLASPGVGLSVEAGVIDSDYRGEVSVILHNHSSKPFRITPDRAIAQILFIPLGGIPAPLFPETIVWVDDLDDTSRLGGFGSTDRA